MDLPANEAEKWLTMTRGMRVWQGRAMSPGPAIVSFVISLTTSILAGTRQRGSILQSAPGLQLDRCPQHCQELGQSIGMDRPGRGSDQVAVHIGLVYRHTHVLTASAPHVQPDGEVSGAPVLAAQFIRSNAWQMSA